MNRSRTWKAMILASAQAAAALVTLLIVAALSRMFDMGDYATYRQTILAYSFAGPLLALGLPAALYYFMPGEESRARAILIENLLLLGLAGLAFAVFLLMGGNVLLAGYFKNPALEETLLIISVYPLLVLPASATTACLMARDKVSWVALYTIGTSLAKLAIVLGAVWFISATPTMAIIGTVVAASVVLVTSLFFMFAAVRGTGGMIGSSGMKAQLVYAIPMGVGAMLGVLHRGIDKILVGFFTVPENFAVYINGAMEIPFIGVITGSATAVLLPEMRRLIKEGDNGKALAIWKRAGIKTAVILIPMLGILMVTAPDVMAIIYSEKYRDSQYIFRIYLLLLPIRIVIFGAVFQAAGRPDLILKRSILALVANGVLSVAFALLWGYEFIALATVAAIYLVVLPYCLWKVSSIFKIRLGNIFPWELVARLLMATAVGSGIAMCVTLWFPSELSILRAGVTGAVYLGIMLIILPTTNIIQFKFDRGVRLENRIRWNI